MAQPTVFDKCINVFVKSPYCTIAESEHTASVNKMYFVIRGTNIKYKCAACEMEIVEKLNTPEIKKLFALKTVSNTDEELSLQSVSVQYVGILKRMPTYWTETGDAYYIPGGSLLPR